MSSRRKPSSASELQIQLVHIRQTSSLLPKGSGDLCSSVLQEGTIGPAGFSAAVFKGRLFIESNYTAMQKVSDGLGLRLVLSVITARPLAFRQVNENAFYASLGKFA